MKDDMTDKEILAVITAMHDHADELEGKGIRHVYFHAVTTVLRLHEQTKRLQFKLGAAELRIRNLTKKGA